VESNVAASMVRRSLTQQKDIRMHVAGNSPKLEVLATLERELLLRLAGRAFLSDPV
jgi:hypothetical protein